jgi:hypothetical protein
MSSDGVNAAPGSLGISSLAENFAAFSKRVNLVIAIDHSGRAGNGFFQAIFDQHPQVLTCPWMHYVYSYIETEFGDGPVLDAARAREFLAAKAYFRYVYCDADATRAKEITKFGGDPTAVMDRSLVRSVFDEVFRASDSISRRDAVIAMYYCYALGLGRELDQIKYVLVTDSISLRLEDPSSGFSGRVLDRVVHDFPAARIVQLVRDPRASFASTNHQYLNSAGNMYGIHFGNYWESVKLLWHARFDWVRVHVFGFLLAYFWQAFLAVERKVEQYREHVLRVRNEDLNLNFVPTMRQLCSWLGVGTLPEWSRIDYVPTMLGRPWTGTGAYNSAYQKNTYGPLSNDPDSVARAVTGPNEYVTRRWRTRLSRSEIYLIEWVLRLEIERYGYELLELRSDNGGFDDLKRALWRPMRGELPSVRWLFKGRHIGWREFANRAFFLLAFPPFYVGTRLQLLRMMRDGTVFAGR